MSNPPSAGPYVRYLDYNHAVKYINDIALQSSDGFTHSFGIEQWKTHDVISYCEEPPCWQKTLLPRILTWFHVALLKLLKWFLVKQAFLHLMLLNDEAIHARHRHLEASAAFAWCVLFDLELDDHNEITEIKASEMKISCTSYALHVTPNPHFLSIATATSCCATQVPWWSPANFLHPQEFTCCISYDGSNLFVGLWGSL